MVLGFFITLAVYFHFKRRSLSEIHFRCANIYHWVCLGKGDSADPSGVVKLDSEGERLALSLKQQIHEDHPNWSEFQKREKLATQIYDPKSRAQVISSFHWTLQAMEHYLETQPEETLSKFEKTRLILRLKEVQLEIPPPASLYHDAPHLLIEDELFFQRVASGQMRLRVGGAYLLIARSWFNLIFSFAHELGHAIDPCEMRSYGIEIPAYQRLTRCFLDHGLIIRSKSSLDCGPNDQLSEAFADWLGMEVTAEALTFFSTEFHGSQILKAARNSVRDLCVQDGDEETLDVDLHPHPKVRIEKIFGRQPIVRQILGCPNYRVYHENESFDALDEGERCTFDYQKEESENAF